MENLCGGRWLAALFIFLAGCAIAPVDRTPKPDAAMHGMFRYMADAARFEDCATGRSYPVAMEGDYLALERAYTAAPGAGPGAPLLARFEGDIVERPPMEGPGPVPTVVVRRFIGVAPGESCTRGLRDTAWVLSSLSGRAPVAGSTVTLRFDGARVQGTDGCNRYSAPYTAEGSKLQVGPRGASTQMACPAALMQQAVAYMDALTQARGYRLAAGGLELMAADDGVLVAFTAQPQSLAGTSWRVTGYNNGRQAVVSVLAGTSLTMTFSGDGRVSGSAGCNSYTASYRSEGGKLVFGPAAATRKMCPSPERVMEQEREFLQALGPVANARFEGNRLELRTEQGALAVVLTKVEAR